MVVQVVKKTKKIIDLKPEIKKGLSLQAVNNGLSLKAYIEQILEEQVVNERLEDSYLIKMSEVPEANVYLSEEEKKNFELKLFGK